MRNDKEKATVMRREGKSYREIKKSLMIPVSTLSDCFSGLEWSKDIATKLAKEMEAEHTARIVYLNKIRGQHLKRAYEEAREEAREELKTFKYNPLFIAGLMLYWGEGDKLTSHSVKLTNTDPDMIKFFIHFLTRACRIPVNKIKLHLLVYPDLSDELCKEHWSKVSGLDKTHFTKTTVIPGRHKVRRLPFGVCMVTISSTYLKVKMLEWMRILPLKLMEREYYENM